MNESSIQTRSLEEGDLDRVVDIDAQAGGVRRGDFFWKRWRAATDAPEVYIALVAVSAGEIMGFIMAHVLSGEFGTDERFAVVDGLGVASGRRRAGIGTKLVESLKREAGQRNCSELRTQAAWEQQHLLAFFAGAGFTLADVNVLARNLADE